MRPGYIGKFGARRVSAFASPRACRAGPWSNKRRLVTSQLVQGPTRDVASEAIDTRDEEYQEHVPGYAGQHNNNHSHRGDGQHRRPRVGNVDIGRGFFADPSLTRFLSEPREPTLIAQQRWCREHAPEPEPSADWAGIKSAESREPTVGKRIWRMQHCAEHMIQGIHGVVEPRRLGSSAGANPSGEVLASEGQFVRQMQ